MKSDKDRYIYEMNVAMLSEYEHCEQAIFPEFENLSFISRMEEDYAEFLAQIDSDTPILLHNNMSVESISYIVANLRSSDRFGRDNHLYLFYSNVSKFSALLVSDKWKEIIDSRKVVIFFSDMPEHYDHLDPVTRHEPMMLEISEVNTMIHRVSWAHGAGGNFFSTILDFHPFLLTITPMGLQQFNLLYSEFMENRIVSEALSLLANPQTERQKYAFEMAFYGVWNIFPKAKRIDKDILLHYLEKLLKDGKADASQWFKAIFIAYAYSFGRSFKSRISPAILYGHEGGYSDVFEKNLATNKTLDSSVFKSFKFYKAIMNVRDPITILGYMYEAVFNYYKNHHREELVPQPYSLKALEVKFQAEDERLDTWRVIRFEDLKLYPKETLEKLCKFCILPWSDSLLHLTVQGESAGEFAGTNGFDTAPLYKNHDLTFSMFDAFRMEIIGPKFDSWGYGRRYYDEVRYDRETILKMFELPFKWEMFLLQRMDLRKKFHDNIRQLILKILNEDGTKKDTGFPTHWVKWLRPDVGTNETLYVRFTLRQ